MRYGWQIERQTDRRRGGDLGGDWGTVPPNLRWGRPMHPSPNILRNSVVGCARKYEQSKKCVFLVRKGSYTTFNIVKIWNIWEKRGNIRKTWSMTKEKVIRNFCRENGNFSEILVREKMFRPPNLAPGLRHYSIVRC